MLSPEKMMKVPKLVCEVPGSLISLSFSVSFSQHLLRATKRNLKRKVWRNLWPQVPYRRAGKTRHRHIKILGRNSSVPSCQRVSSKLQLRLKLLVVLVMVGISWSVCVHTEATMGSRHYSFLSQSTDEETEALNALYFVYIHAAGMSGMICRNCLQKWPCIKALLPGIHITV